MVTELAKGKSLEEALKITREDVATSLDGLPPVKMHCSNLASEALSEAIYDYYKKNDIPVPEELEKKHEKLKQIHDHIEQRYEEFTEVEKTLLEE
jgi:nitrogen fixation NifU-like protein